MDQKERNRVYYQKNKERIRKKRNLPEEIQRRKEYRRDYYKKNKEHLKEESALHHKRQQKDRNYRLRKSFNVRRAEAKKREIPFEITFDDLEFPKKCPVLGVKLDYNLKGKRNDNSPSIDRIDNTKGYIKGNVHIISWRANTLKSDASLVEMKLLFEYFLKLKLKEFEE